MQKPVYPEPTHDNGWQCVDGMIEPGDFIPQQLADVLVEENIAGLTERDESDDEFDDALYCYCQKINAVTQVSQQKTKVSKIFSKNVLCYKKSILQYYSRTWCSGRVRSSCFNNSLMKILLSNVQTMLFINYFDFNRKKLTYILKWKSIMQIHLRKQTIKIHV